MRGVKRISQLIIRLALAKFFNPLEKRIGITTKFPLYIDAYSFLFKHITFLGLYEPQTTLLIRKLLKEGMTFVDLGAHRGYFTLWASELVGETGRVFAFEPAPENFTFLKANLRRKRNVTLVQKAVSNKVGSTKLFLSDRYTSNHTIYDTGSLTVGENRRAIEVEVTTLDEFFKGMDLKIDVIKMDIEGAEASALEGMSNIIAKNENLKIITELKPYWMQMAGYSPEGFLTKLMEYHFKLYVINEVKECIEPVEPVGISQIVGLSQSKKKEFANFFCEKDS